jgi:hypothetical protein
MDYGLPISLGEIEMRKVTFAFMSIWAALALALAGRATAGRMHGEWMKLAARVAQQPLPFDMTHMLASIDPDGRLLHAVTTMAA